MSKCKKCGKKFNQGSGALSVQGETVISLLIEYCVDCETVRAEMFGTRCENCGGLIPPGAQVGATPDGHGKYKVFHTTYECSPPGGTFYAVWGDGKLVSAFTKIEQC